MDLGFCFGMMCGAEINLSKIYLQIFLGWHIVKIGLCSKQCLGMSSKRLEYNFRKNP